MTRLISNNYNPFHERSILLMFLKSIRVDPADVQKMFIHKITSNKSFTSVDKESKTKEIKSHVKYYYTKRPELIHRMGCAKLITGGYCPYTNMTPYEAITTCRATLIPIPNGSFRVTPFNYYFEASKIKI